MAAVLPSAMVVLHMHANQAWHACVWAGSIPYATIKRSELIFALSSCEASLPFQGYPAPVGNASDLISLQPGVQST